MRSLLAQLLALLLAACEPPPKPAASGDSGAGGTDGTSDGSDGSAADPPYDQNLLADASFEDASLGAWAETGGCARMSVTTALTPVDGDAFLGGVRGSDLQDCAAIQVLDLAALDFDLDEIDGGRVAVEAEAWLADDGPAGSYDDQVLLRVRFLDEVGAPLSSVETLVGGTADWTLRGATALLPAETRALSVEVAGRFRDPPDNDSYADALAVSLHVVAPTSPSLTLAPLLQDYRTDAMRVTWETDGNLGWNRVDYGADGDLSQHQTTVRTIAVTELNYVHVAEMDDLEAGTAVDYQVVSGDTASAAHRFRAAPSPDAESVLIGWLADNQEGYNRFTTHLEHLSARSPDLLVVPGDIVGDHERLVEWREWWWGPLVDTNNFGSATPVLVARGNHDRHHPYAYAYVQLPGNGIFYSYRYGPVFVVALDSQILPDHLPDSINQRLFLEQVLESEEARSAAFRVVTFHNAPFTNASGTGADGNEAARDSWVPLFESGGVDLVITGHYHSYQRGTLDGISYVVVGGGGSTLLMDTWDNWDFLEVVDLTWQYSTMQVDGDNMVWQTFNLDDELIDAFELTGGAR